MSELVFDPSSGVVVPEPKDVRAEVAKDLKSIFAKPGQPELDTQAGTTGGQLVDMIAGERISANAKIAFIAQQLNPAIASGRWQEALGKLYFLERKLSEPTVVTCQVRGINGTVIPYGAQAGTSDGEVLMATGPITIGTDGTGEGLFRMMQAGPVEIGPHAVESIITMIPGWDSITNAASGATGRLEETRAEFEYRRMSSVAKNSKYYLESIESEVADVSGVIDCKVLENYTNIEKTESGIKIPGHSIAVCVYGGDDNDIAMAIARKKTPGTGTTGNTTVTAKGQAQDRIYEFQIVRPTPMDVYVEVTLDSSISPNIKEELIDAIYDEFMGNGASGRDRVSLAETLYAFRFAPSVIEVIGSHAHLVNVQVALGDGALSGQIVINANVEPVFSRSNITLKQVNLG